VNILYSCDDKYSPYTGVSVTSLFENNKDLDEINVYILGLRISDGNTQKFNQLAEQYDRNIIIIDAEELNDFLDAIGARQWRGTTAIWYRLFVERFIDEKVDKILYVDSDTLIMSSLAELADFSFDENKALAMLRWKKFKGYNKLIGLQENDFYYNNGVIFFNVANWIALRCPERIMEAIEKGYVNFMNPEQDLLCHLFQGNIQCLPPRYNVLTQWIDVGVKNLSTIRDINDDNFYPLEKIEEAIRNPAIAHVMKGHTGVPWVEGNKNPFKKEWHMYKKMSPWRDMPQVVEKRSFTNNVKIIMFAVLPKNIYCRILKVVNIWYTKRHYRKHGHFSF